MIQAGAAVLPRLGRGGAAHTYTYQNCVMDRRPLHASPSRTAQNSAQIQKHTHRRDERVRGQPRAQGDSTRLTLLAICGGEEGEGQAEGQQQRNCSSFHATVAQHRPHSGASLTSRRSKHTLTRPARTHATCLTTLCLWTLRTCVRRRRRRRGVGAPPAAPTGPHPDLGRLGERGCVRGCGRVSALVGPSPLPACSVASERARGGYVCACPRVRSRSSSVSEAGTGDACGGDGSVRQPVEEGPPSRRMSFDSNHPPFASEHNGGWGVGGGGGFAIDVEDSLVCEEGGVCVREVWCEVHVTRLGRSAVGGCGICPRPRAYPVRQDLLGLCWGELGCPCLLPLSSSSSSCCHTCFVILLSSPH